MSGLLRDKDLDYEFDNIMGLTMDDVYQKLGYGSYNSRFVMSLAKFDRYGYTGLTPNHETTGFTFMTRPTLNLSTNSLLQDRTMTLLNAASPFSLAFSIRAYLDPDWARTYIDVARACPFYNQHSPFLIPITNNLTDMSGFPDSILDTQTSDTGFFGEDQTIVRGSDMGMQTYDISVTVNDIQNAYLFYMFYYWYQYMTLVTSQGVIYPYMNNLLDRRLDYTVSIYRFTTDTTRRRIVKWSKATGCFPTGVPSGNMFNINQNEKFIHAAKSFSVNFKVNHFTPVDPIILLEFNTLVETFCPDITGDGMVTTESNLENNFTGIPYINMSGGKFELVFRAYEEELANDTPALIDKYTKQLTDLRYDAMKRALESQNNSLATSTNDLIYI